MSQSRYPQARVRGSVTVTTPTFATEAEAVAAREELKARLARFRRSQPPCVELPLHLTPAIALHRNSTPYTP